MLIGIDASRVLRPQPTGTERYALEIIRALLAQPETQRHQWRLYVDHIPRGDEPWANGDLPHNAELCHLPQRKAWTHRALAAEILERPPSVLFVPSHVLPFILPAKRLPPSVVTIHDLGYHYFPETRPWRQRLYLDWSTRWNVAASRAVIAVSQATAADLEKVLGAHAGKIHVVYEAAELLDQPTPEQIARVKGQYGLDHPYALYVGTLQPRKNLVRLIRAFDALCLRQEANFDLVLAGNAGWLSQEIVAAAYKSPNRARIHLPGYVAENDRPALLAGAQQFAFPSLYEGFGLPILEAQSLGVPVMSAKGSSLPEVAGDAALYVDPTDIEAIAQAMLRLSQDETLRQRLIAAGHQNIERFSWTKAASETLAVLEEAARQER